MAAVVLPNTTTGTISVWGGTKDGKDAYIDHQTRQTNVIPPCDIPITAQDVRSFERKPSYEKDGYEMMRSPTQLKAEDFLNSNTEEGKKLIQDVYYEECRRLVEKTTKAALVFPVTFRIRQDIDTKVPEPNQTEVVSKGLSKNPRPIAHVDRDPTTAIIVLRDIVGDERAEELLKKHKRWAQVNVWRPIENVAQRWPLTFMNHENIADWSYDEFIGRVYNYNDPRQQFRGAIPYDTVAKGDPRYVYHYASNMTPDEVWVFSSFDSDPKMVQPHGAFWDRNTPVDAPPRRSIEMRSLVFW
ncbi:hypothetical protein GGR54DRAFT_271281 [Hypoxylon sp. NC1633]|nr:hypothetical protein GGR54DRAFT_271281 [Hypoxylon sp. NC1633]